MNAAIHCHCCVKYHYTHLEQLVMSTDNCTLHRHLSHYQECYQDIATAFSHLVGHLTECDASLAWMETMGDERSTDNEMHV